MGNVPDFTDLLDKGKVLTSNAAAVLRGLIEAGESGAELALENLRPLAEQLDAAFGNENDPVPDPPTGGVPVDAPLSSDADAAARVGVV